MSLTTSSAPLAIPPTPFSRGSFFCRFPLEKGARGICEGIQNLLESAWILNVATFLPHTRVGGGRQKTRGKRQKTYVTRPVGQNDKRVSKKSILTPTKNVGVLKTTNELAKSANSCRFGSGRRGSNPRRPAWEAGILPLNYSRNGNQLIYNKQTFITDNITICTGPFNTTLT